MRPRWPFLSFGLVILVLLSAAKMAFMRHAGQVEAPPSDPAKLEDPLPGETCFSPDEPCDAKLMRFILGAKKSLDIAIYDINLDALVHHLAIQAKKITVRVVVDQRQSKGAHSLVDLLVKAGVNVRYGRQRGIMHNKLIIRDNAMVETGSFNYTNHAAKANNENQVYLDTPSIVGRYQERFEKIWADAEPIAAPREAPPKAESPKASYK